MNNANWQDLLKFGGVAASVVLSAGMLLAQVEGLKTLLQEQRVELRAASISIQAIQIDSARRSAEFTLLDRRLTQIEARLNIPR